MSSGAKGCLFTIVFFVEVLAIAAVSSLAGAAVGVVVADASTQRDWPIFMGPRRGFPSGAMWGWSSFM